MYPLGNSLLFTVDLPRRRTTLWTLDIGKETRITNTDELPSILIAGPAVLWEYVPPDSLHEVSGPFNCSGSTRFIISGSSMIQGIIVHPHLPAETTQVFRLYRYPSGHSVRSAILLPLHRLSAGSTAVYWRSNCYYVTLTR